MAQNYYFWPLNGIEGKQTTAKKCFSGVQDLIWLMEFWLITYANLKYNKI